MAAILESRPDYSLPGERPRPPLRAVPAHSRRMRGVYRRRRFLAAVLLILMLVGVLVTGRTVAMALSPAPLPGGAGQPAPMVNRPAAIDVREGLVVVQPGDTLWAVARRLQPAGDVRPLVDRLAAAHGPGPLYAGERLVIPVDD